MLIPALSACLALAGCDSNEPVAGTILDPATVDYDQIETFDYGDTVQPLLAARNVFASTATDQPADSEDYDWDDVFQSAWGETIIPFDEEGSWFVRYVEDLRSDAAIPYPNLRALEADEFRYLKRWIADGAKNDDGIVPYADVDHILYACEQGQNSVALIDMVRHQVIRRVYLDDHDLSSTPNGPHHIAFEPDGSAWFTSIISAGRIAKFSTDLSMDPSSEDYLIAASPGGGFTTPGMLAVDPHSNRLYAGRSTLSSGGTFGMGAFDRTSLEQVMDYPLPGFDVPHALGLTPDARFILTASLTGDRAVVVDTQTGDIVSQAEVGGTRELVHMNVLPDGRTATLTANTQGGASDVLFFTLDADGTLTPDGSVSAGPDGSRAWHAHLDHDGRTLLVPLRSGSGATLIDVPERRVRMSVRGPDENSSFAQPHSPAPSHDGSVFFVTDSNLNGSWTPDFLFLGDDEVDGQRAPEEASAFGNVTVVDEATGNVIKVIQLGAGPSGLEHPMHGGMDHEEMDHEEMDHGGMDHEEHGQGGQE